jgi:hypothetical protein
MMFLFLVCLKLLGGYTNNLGPGVVVTTALAEGIPLQLWLIDKYPEESVGQFLKTSKGRALLGGLAHWVDPILSTSTEQVSTCSIRVKLWGRNSPHLGWIGCSAQELERPLIDTERVFSDSLFRYSLGVGYRHARSAAHIVGAYVYYDHIEGDIRHYTGGWEAAYGWEAGKLNRDTISVGLEYFAPLGRLIGNLYLCDASISPLLFKYTAPCWAGDIKLSKSWKQMMGAVGVYYSREVMRVRGETQRYNVYGIAGELNYTYKAYTYGIKYTYDTRNKHQGSFQLQWRPMQPFRAHGTSQLWVPEARYLGPYRANAAGKQWLDCRKDALDQALRAATQRKAELEAERKRRWHAQFVIKYVSAVGGAFKPRVPWFTKEDLTIFTPFREVLIVPTDSDYLEVIPQSKSLGTILQLLHNVPKSRPATLQQLFAVRSILDNLNLLEAHGQHKTAANGLNRSEIKTLYDKIQPGIQQYLELYGMGPLLLEIVLNNPNYQEFFAPFTCIELQVSTTDLQKWKLSNPNIPTQIYLGILISGMRSLPPELRIEILRHYIRAEMHSWLRKRYAPRSLNNWQSNAQHQFSVLLDEVPSIGGSKEYWTHADQVATLCNYYTQRYFYYLHGIQSWQGLSHYLAPPD